MEQSCGHSDDNFRLKTKDGTRRVCWFCLADDLPELEVNGVATVTRLVD